MAFCEGDDFWTDENKLQIQYDIMEKDPNCHFCVHKVISVSESGKDLNITFPNFKLKEKTMSPEEILTFSSNEFRLNSYFIRREDYENYISNFVIIRQMFLMYGIGDVPLFLYFGHLNKTYYINKVMAKYRKNSLGSWSLKTKSKSKNYLLQKCTNYIKDMKELDKYTLYKYHKIWRLKSFYASFRIVKFTNNRKALLFQKRRDFFGSFNLFQKTGLLVAVFLPVLALIIREVYQKIYEFSNTKRRSFK